MRTYLFYVGMAGVVITIGMLTYDYFQTWDTILTPKQRLMDHWQTVVLCFVCYAVAVFTKPK